MEADGAPPNPDTCTPDQWDAYLASVDVAALTWVEVDEHRALVERYTTRLLRESATARAESTRLLDARDQTNAEAEALSERCRDLQRQLIEASDAVLRARREHGYGSPEAGDASQQEDRISEALVAAQAELTAANLRAIQAARDAM